MRVRRGGVALLAAVGLLGLAGPQALPRAAVPGSQAAPRFEQVLPLAAGEGVFAYSRISPDGRLLAYASESRATGRSVRTVTLVELATRKVLFQETGIDAYFSNDGTRMIYLAQGSGRSSVAIRHTRTGTITRDVAPEALGDYFSWAVRDGRDLILTIRGNYYYLDGDAGVMPHASVPTCPGIGRGERPLISKDGRRITTFVRGTVVVRGLDHCDDVVETGIEGAKADFSFDGRYIAMHAADSSGSRYDVLVVDLVQRTVRNVTASLKGSSSFPSWTADGRLSFRHDSPEYRGFMFASNVLSVPARPLGRTTQTGERMPRWNDVFPETASGGRKFDLVMVWAPWSAHAPDALEELQRAEDYFRRSGRDVRVATATDGVSADVDVAWMLSRHAPSILRIPLSGVRLTLTGMHNQNPAMLLFRDGVLAERRLGAQTFEQLREWVEELE